MILEMACLTFLGDRGEHLSTTDFDGKCFRRDNRHDMKVSGLYAFLKEPNHNKTQSW